ncbi:flavoprotein [Stackebrandtia nassauensis]|uniref:flavoprotein n=1 Tax=Stackebrandtia nassauensis TaxID=283811 RepID=UPI001B7F7B8E|nr:flavoprotein [Stackebrandtia nassauensis]
MTSQPVLQVIVCGSPLAADIGEVLVPAVRDGWDVWVVASEYGIRFLDADAAEAVTGHPVHYRYRHPDDPVDVPYADAIVVVPATCNTLAKWTAGICDTLALGLLVEAYGRGCPVTVVPFSNRAQASHPAVVDSIGRLRGWGVNVLFGDDFFPLHEPGTGTQVQRAFPWGRVREEIARMRSSAPCRPWSKSG